MAQSNVNIRMDDSLKKDFDCICNQLGMNMSTAITIFAKKMVRENRIPFDVSIDPFYSDANMQVLMESKRQLESGKTVTKTIAELEQLEHE